MGELTVSVVVPTYKRPDYLERCVRSVFSQTRLPNELILVSRDTDKPTNVKIAFLQKELGHFIPIINPHVTEAGFLPPIERGIEYAKYDIVVFLDDDAEAFSDWLQRIAAHYDNTQVGGVGGRYVNYFDFKLAEYKPVSKVGYLSWYGRSVGNLYKDTTFSRPVEVDFFIGGNMSFRRFLLRRIHVESILNENVAFHWELDIGQQVKQLGYTLLFDPAIKVNHYSAPRETDGMRTVNYLGVYHSNFNYSYLMLKHLPLPGKFAYLLYSFLVGSQMSSGLGYLVVRRIRGQHINWRNDVLPSLRGRIAGVAAYMRRAGFIRFLLRCR